METPLSSGHGPPGASVTQRRVSLRRKGSEVRLHPCQVCDASGTHPGTFPAENEKHGCMWCRWLGDLKLGGRRTCPQRVWMGRGRRAEQQRVSVGPVGEGGGSASSQLGEQGGQELWGELGRDSWRAVYFHPQPRRCGYLCLSSYVFQMLPLGNPHAPLYTCFPSTSCRPQRSFHSVPPWPEQFHSVSREISHILKAKQNKTLCFR